jgi:hypothetical protein
MLSLFRAVTGEKGGDSFADAPLKPYSRQLVRAAKQGARRLSRTDDRSGARG